MRNLIRRKLYSIVGTDFRSKALAMYMTLKVMAKLGGMTHWVKPMEKPGGMKKK